MKIDNALNLMVLDMLKTIISMAEKPTELGAYITTRIRKLVGCNIVAMIIHNENHQEEHHRLLGICPERRRNLLHPDQIRKIAGYSHEMHVSTVIQHAEKGTELEQFFSEMGGNCSILVPLEYGKNRIGVILLIGIFDDQNLKTALDSLDALSGVLALEMRNATFLKTLEDKVTERTKELSASENRFRTIIEQSTDAMFLSDLDGNIVDANQQACKSLGYSREELYKLNIADVDETFSDIKKVKELFAQITSNKIFRFEAIHRSKDGNTFPVELSSSIIELNGRNHIIGFAREISDRKLVQAEIQKLNAELESEVAQRTFELHKRTIELTKNEGALLNLVEDLNEKTDELSRKSDQLQLVNKELEAFSYSVSHDLRAPLRHINGFIDLFLEAKSTHLTDEELGYLKTVTNSANEMGNLIDALLTFSRLHLAELLKKPIETLQLIQQGLKNFDKDIKVRAVELIINPLPETYGDYQLLGQVWTNLLSNAFKYTGKTEKAIIEIGGYKKNNETIFFIKDNGAGFNMKYANKLFGVFQRLHKPRDFEGIGIGLANINRIIVRHGGRCWAEGEVDKGATFYFTLN